MYSLLLLLLALSSFAKLQFHDSCDTRGYGMVNNSRTTPRNRTATIRTVDVFFTVESQTRSHRYIYADHFWVVPILLERMARLQKQADGTVTTDTRIHIFSSSDYILKKGQFMGDNIYMWDARIIHPAKQKRFFDFYSTVHFSVNVLEYEFLCFNRWHIYRWAMEWWNENHSDSEKMTRILTLDLDVVLFKNAAVFFDDILASLTPNYDELASIEV